MHIKVLLRGFVLGPVFGVAIGAAAPLISALITGMPPLVRLPFMVIELMGYGFASGVMYKSLGFCNKRYGTVISLIAAMVFGRLLYALTLFIAADLLGVSAAGAVEAVRATVAGVYGIILQIIIIPALVYSLKRIGYFELLVGKGKKDIE